MILGYFLMELPYVLFGELPRSLLVQIELLELIEIDLIIRPLYLTLRHARDLCQLLQFLFLVIEVNFVKSWSLHVVKVLVASLEGIIGDVHVLVTILTLHH